MARPFFDVADVSLQLRLVAGLFSAVRVEEALADLPHSLGSDPGSTT